MGEKVTGKSNRFDGLVNINDPFKDHSKGSTFVPDGGGGLQHVFTASHPISIPADLANDSLDITNLICQFDDATKKAVGLSMLVPNFAIQADLIIMSRPNDLPGAIKAVELEIYQKIIAVGAPILWSVATSRIISIANSLEYVETNLSIPLTNRDKTSTKNIKTEYDFQIARSPGGSDTLVGDWNLLSVRMNFR